MRKNICILLFSIAASCFLLTACSVSNNQIEGTKLSKESSAKENENTVDTEEIDELSEPFKLYKSFLRDEITSETKEDGEFYLKDFCNVVVPEETEDGIRYALYDMTGDSLPELHVLTDISYSVHTIENDQLITWYEGDRYCRPLNNGMMFSKHEATGIHYSYWTLDSKGEEIFSVNFSRPPEGAEDSEVYDYLFSITNGKETEYEDFGEVKVSKKEWNKLTKHFLEMKSDQIIWKDISDFSGLDSFESFNTEDTGNTM